MLDIAVTRSPAQTQIDPATHAECLQFIRTAISIADRQTAAEQERFKKLLAPPPLAREFAQRIRETIGYQSPVVAGAVQTDLERASDRGELSAADVAVVVGAAELARFNWIAETFLQEAVVRLLRI